MRSLVFIIYTALHLLNIQHTTSQTCEFRIGAVSYLSGTLQTIGESISSGYKMAMYDYTESTLYNQQHLTSNIESLSTNIGDDCTLSMDLRDIETDIKVGIVEIFQLSSTYDECVTDYNDNNNNNETCNINTPIIIGPATSGHCLTTNPLVEAFNLLQFSPSATSTFLSNYESFYRPIPSDDTQAKALIDLCKYFGWMELGILYIATDYGTSLQRALTSYANTANIKSTTFSYITEDNVTLSDAVEAMHDSNIFIFILIVYDGDVGLLSHLLQNVHDMIQYPYYYVGVDSWLYATEFTWPDYLPIYGGMIGSCPWSPSLNDPLYELYPYPLNISLQMYNKFYNEYILLQEAGRIDITFNISSPGIFTIYAYDVMLTVIKLIDQYIQKFNITNMDQFYNRLYNVNISNIHEFKQILSDIWFIGLSGNVSYKTGGDRYGGLFSFCNVHPETGIIKQFGFSFGNQIIVNEEDITWPIHSYNKDNIPKTSYSSFNGICTKSGSSLPILIWLFIFLSMFIIFIYFGLLYYYRNRKIIRASQWQLSLCMASGCVVCYISLILFGIDESFPTKNKLNYNWSVLCNFRIFLLNLSFSLIFLPLFTKIYRIKKIFSHAMVQLKRYQTPAKTLFLYNAIFVVSDSILCIILISVIPYTRIYRNGEIINFATTQWGSCSSQPYSYVYFIILGIPKLMFSLYCIILSISVYSTVSMMKFNEGLQVLICMVISVLLIFVTVGISSIITVNNSTTSIFFYAFISFILLMICNFCCAVMILPRLFSIWKGLSDDEYVNKNDEDKAVKKYMKTLRSNLNKLNNKFNSTLSVNITATGNNSSKNIDVKSNTHGSPNADGSTIDLTGTHTNNASSREDHDQTQQEIMLKKTNQ